LKTLGIIGGIAPGSTVDYYHQIIAVYREQRPDGSYPLMIINSIDLNKMLGFVFANQLDQLADYLAAEVQKLADAGADFGLLASNTPHIVFDRLSERSPIPLISIVECACEAAKQMGLKKLGLLGMRSTMQGRFYPDVFSRAGISLIVPKPEEQDYIHEKYLGELVNENFLAETRERILAIIQRMKEEDGIEGAVLGGTELPLLLRNPSADSVPFLNTTQIHVQAAVERLLK
jgi:aspartate racemase